MRLRVSIGKRSNVGTRRLGLGELARVVLAACERAKVAPR